MANLSVYSDQVVAHRRWLGEFDGVHRKKWDSLLKRDPEPALIEALVRAFLAQHVDAVEPAEDPAKGGPDFRCRVGQKCFYTEATCIRKSSVVSKTGLPDGTDGFFSKLTDAFFQECIGKAKQCANLDNPCLLALGTLHFEASILCFGAREAELILTGEARLSWQYDERLGRLVGEPWQSTELRNSPFLKPPKVGGGGIDFARQSISGVLLCGFGIWPPVVNGVLHPNAKRPFDRSLLPDVPFCRLEDSYQQGRLGVVWD